MSESFVAAEIASQPACWRRAAEIGAGGLGVEAGERVAVVGCGTSWFMAMAYAALREGAGHGVTDAFAASEAPLGRDYDRRDYDRRDYYRRDYDRVVAISRSGTTTEVVDLLRGHAGRAATTVVTGVAGSPVTEVADTAVVLEFADERSVVQTRFATSTLALLRASLGEDLGAPAADCARVLELPVAGLAAAEQITFLGRGWTVGLAAEAALKLREAAGAWTESYPAMEYRHGPISIARPGRATWMFGPAPDGLADEVTALGADFVSTGVDPMAQLVLAQRVAVAMAAARGLDPDNPRGLSRSVILAGA
ncbi:SIS domain-containing protein [Actinokineospora guangxiensis]|uniref:SIS domain-containing protein n=1 Tax=Actinokineospora guangxiensis TaxID=1490288 RepID=A0ABW0ESF0_9PSEU